MDCTQTRLFPPHPEGVLLSTKQIVELARILALKISEKVDHAFDTQIPRHKLLQPLAFEPLKDDQHSLEIPAGFTYLGQMISHDIVAPTNPKGEEAQRHVTPCLNMDSMYGDGPDFSADTLFNPTGKFVVPSHINYDVWRNTAGVAHIPEPRNDENTIVCQMHRVWQNLHNRFLVETGHFIQAKQATISMFHQVVVTDFLSRLLDPVVYQHFFIESASGISDFTTPIDAIPCEFSHAAFRIGHSLVRPVYRMNHIQPSYTLSIGDLLRGNKSGDIPPEQQIDWSLFFGQASQKAGRLDLSLSGGMADVPAEGNIVTLNLLAGNKSQLPSGYDLRHSIEMHFAHLAKATGLTDSKPVAALEESHLSEAYQILKPIIASEKLPLWLYILLESGLSQPANTRLGKLGSIIIADVLRHSIASFYAAQQTTMLTKQRQPVSTLFSGNLSPVMSNWIAQFGDSNITMTRVIQYSQSGVQ
ncbi:peroxidase family protein [Neptunicella marina]|uniref:Animal haem peroxidase n=1 Tax=Neptunicella marina TaxID=2125989 RepID=A0A8J6IW55_9ALTE|nr:peroxidase family protein [Neptunicella marina]MBC3767369.1 hypothetical protein [Neptunicella marina]